MRRCACFLYRHNFSTTICWKITLFNKLFLLCDKSVSYMSFSFLGSVSLSLTHVSIILPIRYCQGITVALYYVMKSGGTVNIYKILYQHFDWNFNDLKIFSENNKNKENWVFSQITQIICSFVWVSFNFFHSSFVSYIYKLCT